MTLAPKSAKVCVQAGPATTRVKSTTRRPSRAVGAPFSLGVRAGSCGLAVMIGAFLPIARSCPDRYGRLYTRPCYPSKQCEPDNCSVTVFSDGCYEKDRER